MRDFAQKIDEEFERLRNIQYPHTGSVLRKTLLDSLHPGLKEVDPYNLVKNSIKVSEKEFIFRSPLGSSNSSTNNEIHIDREHVDEILVIGGGKATGYMAQAIIELIPEEIPVKGVINIPYGQDFGEFIVSNKGLDKKEKIPSSNRKIEVNYASHPLPDEKGMMGVNKMIRYIKQASQNVLIIVLISGGGSALMPLPKKGVTLKDLQQINQLLLNCGASINEINAIRKHLSDFKGGNLAKLIHPKRGISLIISDVMGDKLDVIASGPTYPDSSTFKDIWEILTKYQLIEKIPDSIANVLNKGVSGGIADTPKSGDVCFTSISNLLIGSVELIKKVVKKNLESNGFTDINILTDKTPPNLPQMFGEASEYATNLIETLLFFMNSPLPSSKDTSNYKGYYCISSGEFTVTIRGNGKGGRNQEMLLSFIYKFLQLDSQIREKIINELDFCVISMAFDGIEGNSPAAGALVDINTIEKAKELDLEPLGYLKNNNSYEFFNKIGDCIKTGQTGTNVNDCCVLLIRYKK